MASPSPSEEVLEAYYAGIASFGKLCGTTDPLFQHDAPYQPAGDGTWIVGKRLATVGFHPIRAYFSFGKLPPERDLATRIITAMEESGLPCNSFDVLRIGDAPLQDSELPVKLLIKVEPNQVNWVDGTNLAQRCRSELQRVGLDDVHCEVLEAQLRGACNNSSSSASPTPPTSGTPFFWPISNDWLYPWRRFLLPFTPALGQCISSTDTPHIMGSTGLYLRISANAGTRYTDCLLTCRHVLVKDENDSAINVVSSRESTNPKQLIDVIQPANHRPIKEELAAQKVELEQNIKKFQDKETFDKTETISQRLALYQQQLKHLNAFLAYYDYNADDRKIGSIIASPPISQKIQAPGQSIRRDWAAIRIDQSKFHLGDNILPKNQFYLVSLSDEAILRDLKATGQAFSVEGSHTLLTNYRPDEDMISIEKYITVDSLQIHIDKMKRLDNQAENDTQPIHLDVFKSGFKSDTTHGYLNEIGSYAKDDLFYSQNLCILSQRKNTFSCDGDSGSLVSILCRPRDDKMYDPVVVAAGLLWGGCNPTQKDSWDITYAIPLEYILEDVKQFFSEPGTDVDEVEFGNLKAWEH